MLLTLQQSGPCLGTFLVSIGHGPLTPYTTPINIPEGLNYTIVRQQDLDTNCCFQDWEVDGTFVSDNATYNAVALAGDPEPEITYTANVRYCNEPCTPWYKDAITLASKANCICSNLGVQIVDVCPGIIGGQQGFAIFDRCQPEDPALNLWGISFHVIMVILDPNYLLQTIECICGGNSNPEYLPAAQP